MLKQYPRNKPSVTSLPNSILCYCPAVSFSPLRFFDFTGHHAVLMCTHFLCLFIWWGCAYGYRVSLCYSRVELRSVRLQEFRLIITFSTALIFLASFQPLHVLVILPQNSLLLWPSQRGSQFCSWLIEFEPFLLFGRSNWEGQSHGFQLKVLVLFPGYAADLPNNTEQI